ncbi:hypothetical protein RUND412_009045 [Rhizina undulata]
MSLPPSYASSRIHCCICTEELGSLEGKTVERQRLQNSMLECCGRVVCGECIERNPRFAEYCPFCQTSDSGPITILPPSYESIDPCPSTTAAPTNSSNSLPPSYTNSSSSCSSTFSNSTPGVLHYLHPTDTLTSLSLTYHVPKEVLKATNRLFNDHLLLARRTILIPSSHYRGGSLSSAPVEGEKEASRKAGIKRFQVRTKCTEYEIARFYFERAGGDEDYAVKCWEEDGKWEMENPMGRGKGKAKVKGNWGLRGFGY